MSDLFIAGIIPGLLIGALLMVYAFYYCKKNGEDQAKKMVVVGALHEKGLLKVLKESAFALLSPVIILGCIYTGIASPTEACGYFGVLCAADQYGCLQDDQGEGYLGRFL